MSFQLSSDAQQRIQEALYRGSKIEAIKIYREVTNTGLAEAKHAVEQMEAELRTQAAPLSTPLAEPLRPALPAGLGCAVILLALGVIVLGVLYLVNGRGADKVAEGRYFMALSLVLCMWMVIQGCIISFNPKRLALAYTLIGIGLAILGINIHQILSR